MINGVSLRRKLNGFLYHHQSRKKLGCIAVALSSLWLAWAIGLTDFLFEVDFKEFQWPPYVDVREQVVREMLGERSTYLYYNNWNEFDTVMEPSCASNRLTRRKSLLIIVKTAPHRLANRDAIRATWGGIRQHEHFRIRTVFVLGKQTSADFKSYGDTLASEQHEFGDLLIGNFTDTYRNNTLKLMTSLKFAHDYCSTGPIPYLLLIDDDYMVSMSNLLAEVAKHPPNERLYMGWRFDTTPFRLIFSKHRVSLQNYPFAAYPPYISAGAVLLTGQSVREFYLAFQHLKVYPFDDIYAGITAYELGITPQHNDNFHFWPVAPGDKELFAKAIAVHGYTSKELLQWFRQFNPQVTTP